MQNVASLEMENGKEILRLMRTDHPKQALDFSLMSGAAIEVHDLVKTYQKRHHKPVKAVRGLSFTVRRGEIFGLLGPNGAGKTTTIKILTTLLAPTSGSARVFGQDVVADPLGVRKNICVVIQENAIELYLSVCNNLRTFGRFHGLTGRQIDGQIDRVSDLFGLREYLNEKGMDLSGGLKRRVQVAKTFMVEKPIVFLDEATTGMDAFNKRRTIDAIKEESRKGRTIVLTTHVLDEAEELCDSVAIMNHGRIIARGSVEDVKSMSLRLLYLTLSLAAVSDDLLRAIHIRNPIAVDIKDTTIEVTVREATEALDVLAAVRQTGLLRHFEITSASLEDVFLQLVDTKESAS